MSKEKVYYEVESCENNCERVNELEKQNKELREALKSCLNWIKEGMTETDFIIGFNEQIEILAKCE